MTGIAQPQVYPSPFDAIAEHYDGTFTFSRIGQAQRTAVWKMIERAFRPGDHVLEIGCGTGVDARFLADHGVRVLACDSSSKMIAITKRSLAENGRTGLVATKVLAAEHIASLPPEQPFDGAFSNFGALNCVAHIGRFARELATLLRPGATAMLCWMGPLCLWEMLWYLGRGKPGKAFRRLYSNGVDARIGDGEVFRVRYPAVRTLARTFAPEFRLRSIHGIGVAVPPSYVESWANRFARSLAFTVGVDSILGRIPGIRMLADHVLLRFERL